MYSNKEPGVQYVGPCNIFFLVAVLFDDGFVAPKCYLLTRFCGEILTLEDKGTDDVMRVGRAFRFIITSAF